MTVYLSETLIICLSNLFSLSIKQREPTFNEKKFGDSPTKEKPSIESHEWENYIIEKHIIRIFLNEAIISPIYFNFSFQYKGESLSKDIYILTILSSFGIAFTRFNDVKIKLRGLHLKNIIDSVESILEKLSSHYKSDILKYGLKAIGSVDILGNPIGLFSHVSEGIFDLIDKPIEGFIKGPLDGSVGIVVGASSFLKHTLAGAFNSVEKITGTFATGFSNITMVLVFIKDKEYLKKRENNRNRRPKNALQGLEQGAKKGGFGGFLKGSVKGVAGLIFKPVAGVLEGTAKTAEGIKNTATFFDDKANEKRFRSPRLFFTRNQFYKKFDIRDSEIRYFLETLKKGSLSGGYFILYDLIGDFKLDLLILTTENILCFSTKDKKMKWYIDTKNIMVIEQDGCLVKIFTLNEIKKIKVIDFIQNKMVHVFFDNDRKAEIFKEELFYIKESLNAN